MSRREFPRKVRFEIIKRASDDKGRLVCEGCGLVQPKTWHIDHTIPDALMLDKSRPLTADDGRLLGWDCCHKPKTAVDVSNIARAERRHGKDRGDKKPSRFPKRPPGYRFDWRTQRLVKEAR